MLEDVLERDPRFGSQIGSDRRREVLEAAGELFRSHGYHATSMRDLARALGVQGSSLYAHVASKEELLWEIVRSAAHAFMTEAGRVSAELPPAERLAALIRGHLRVIARQLSTATVFFHEWKFLSPELRAQVVAQRDAYEAHFRSAVASGVASGVFVTEDPKLAATFMLSALNWSYQWFDARGSLSLDELSAHYTALIFRALGADPAPFTNQPFTE